MKAHVLVLSTLFSAVGSPTHAQQSTKFPSIPNFSQVSDQVCIGGQPAMEDLAQLKGMGIRAIVNLRHPAEYNAAEEEVKAKGLGMRYFNIPIDPSHIRDDQVEEFLKITSDRRNLPVFVHCTKGVRVAIFLMIRRVLVDGWRIEDAEAEAQKIGLHNSTLVEFAKNYIADHSKKGVN